MLPSRLGTGLLMDISLMERYSGQAAAAQRIRLSAFLCLAFCLLASPPCLLMAPPTCPPLLCSCLSHSSSCCNSYTLSPTFPLASFLVCLSLSPHLLSSLHPSTSLSHTLVATLKTVVAMVTAMCCGNVKEPNPPRITSLF